MSTRQKGKKKTAAWFLYIVKCRDNTLYIGITNDLPRRLSSHNSGTASRYTRSRLPVELVYHEHCGGRSSALKKEYRLKSLSRKEKALYIKTNQKLVSDRNSRKMKQREFS